MKSSPPTNGKSSPRHLRPSESAWNAVKRWVIPVAVLILAGYLAYTGYEWWQLEQELGRAEAHQQQLLQEQQQLKQEEARYQDPKEIEKEAREQLGLVKEDEVPYVR